MQLHCSYLHLELKDEALNLEGKVDVGGKVKGDVVGKRVGGKVKRDVVGKRVGGKVDVEGDVVVKGVEDVRSLRK